MESIHIGAVVESLRGRDSGKRFAVIGTVESEDAKICLLVADGRTHTLTNPKKKNPIHLQTICAGDAALSEAILSGNLTDKALYRLLAAHEHHA